jgi:hypothetical protein
LFLVFLCSILVTLYQGLTRHVAVAVRFEHEVFRSRLLQRSLIALICLLLV